MYPSLPRGIAGALLVALAGCYDAPRTNPFDPALTPAVELLSVTVDSTRGSALLEWTPYEGKQSFREYRVLRQVKRLVDVDTLAHLTQVQQTSFQDTTPEPEVQYAYWVEVVNQGGFEVESGKQEGVVYALPPVSLKEAEFSSDTATAELIWTQYRGPGFAAYEVRRRTPGLVEETVTTLDEVSDTTYTDSLLDGNTEYTYHVVVRTGWEGIEVSSNEKSGRFYPFDHAMFLPTFSDSHPQTVGLAIDAQDRLYVGITTILDVEAALTAFAFREMNKGLWVQFPGTGFQSFFSEIHPDKRSSIHLAADKGRVYVSVGLRDSTIFVGALDEAGNEIWRKFIVGSGGALPVGLHLKADGDVVVVDDYALLYNFHPDGQMEDPNLTMRDTMKGFVPLRRAVVGSAAGPRGNDWFFLLIPEQGDYQLVAREPRPNGRFDQFEDLVYFDEGIGAYRGETLSPVALAFDRQRVRLISLEQDGRIQVFDARPNVKRRYITQWGRYGSGDGEFAITAFVGAAMAVDSRGMTYVADRTRIQVFGP